MHVGRLPRRIQCEFDFVFRPTFTKLNLDRGQRCPGSLGENRSTIVTESNRNKSFIVMIS